MQWIDHKNGVWRLSVKPWVCLITDERLHLPRDENCFRWQVFRTRRRIDAFRHTGRAHTLETAKQAAEAKLLQLASTQPITGEAPLPENRRRTRDWVRVPSPSTGHHDHSGRYEYHYRGFTASIYMTTTYGGLPDGSPLYLWEIHRGVKGYKMGGSWPTLDVAKTDVEREIDQILAKENADPLPLPEAKRLADMWTNDWVEQPQTHGQGKLWRKKRGRWVAVVIDDSNHYKTPVFRWKVWKPHKVGTKRHIWGDTSSMKEAMAAADAKLSDFTSLTPLAGEAPLPESYHDPDAHEPFLARLKRCYELAGRFVSHNDGTTLVHGSIQGFGNPRIGHAWAELPDGEVWEPASGKALSKLAFDGVYNPQEDARYSHEDTCKMLLRHEHWGPWDEPVVECTPAQFSVFLDGMSAFNPARHPSLRATL